MRCKKGAVSKQLRCELPYPPRSFRCWTPARILGLDCQEQSAAAIARGRPYSFQQNHPRSTILTE